MTYEEIEDYMEYLQPCEEEEINLECHWYSNPYPNINDYVYAYVKRDASTNSVYYCELPEYARDIEAGFHEKDATRGLKNKIKSFNQRLSQDNKLVLKVVEGDPEVKCFDLSYSTADDATEQEHCKSRYKCGSEVQTIMRGVAEKYHIDLIKLYRCIVWPLHQSHGHCYTAFNNFLRLNEPIFDKMVMPPQLKQILVSQITKKIKISETKLKAEFKIQIWHNEGVIIIKEAIKKAMEPYASTGVHITMLTCPIYVMNLSTFNEDESKKVMVSILEAIGKHIHSYKGKFEVTREPSVEKDQTKNMLNLERRKIEFLDENDADEDNDEGMGEVEEKIIDDD